MNPQDDNARGTWPDRGEEIRGDGPSGPGAQTGAPLADVPPSGDPRGGGERTGARHADAESPDAPQEGPARGFDARMLEALVCPRTHAPLDWDPAREELVSRRAGLAYPVRDGIPIMLETEARRLD